MTAADGHGFGWEPTDKQREAIKEMRQSAGHPARDVKAGDIVEYRDAYDHWHRGIADSAIEGTHIDGQKIHDFPVVWVVVAALPEPRRMPWPADDVRPAPPAVPDDPAEWAAELERLRAKRELHG